MTITVSKKEGESREWRIIELASNTLAPHSTQCLPLVLLHDFKRGIIIFTTNNYMTSPGQSGNSEAHCFPG